MVAICHYNGLMNDRAFLLRFCAFLCFAVFNFSALALAAPPAGQGRVAYDMQDFGLLPILHEGRIKPLESFARAQKKYFSGNDRDALVWLRDTIFNPALAENIPLIKITNPDVLNMLGLERSASKLYAHKDINAALRAHEDTVKTILEMPQKDWTPAQADVALLQQKLVDLSKLLASVSAFLPLAAGVPDPAQVDISALPEDLTAHAGQELTYWEALSFEKPLRSFVQQLVQQSGSAFEGYSPAEKAMVHLAFSLESLRANGSISDSFRVIPIARAPKGMPPFLSPWQALQAGPQPSADKVALYSAWRDLARAYHHGSAPAWNEALGTLSNLSQTQSASLVRAQALQLEYYTDRLHPMTLSAGLYGLALLLLGGSAFITALKPAWQKWRGAASGAAFVLVCGGALVHVGFLLARIYILQRPPVSTLFESILFVGALIVVTTLIFYAANRQQFWLACGGVMGLLLQILALSHDQDGDNMMMLSAVLNTNFWLATHVICITAGYGFCLLTSALAHYILGKHALSGTALPHDHLQKMLHVLALLSLLFAAVGTILGGIWADQSWGRFWGWDPKENGALLITLWLIWALHGRISGQMKTLGVTAMLAYLSVVTALSWFGVNLLNVGLHSYGFTSGLAGALSAFIALETALIATLWLVIQKRVKA